MHYCCIGHHLNNDDALWCAVCGSLLQGIMIDGYRLVSYIGNGSSGDVYLAEQPALNMRKVVIKILHRSWSETRVSSFQHEAAILASLAHPYVLPVFAYGVLYKHVRQARQLQPPPQSLKSPQPQEAEPMPYLVLPYAEQGSLSEIFERRGKRPWSLTRVVTIVREMAEALDYAHAQGILHRDVKPANILQMGSHAVLSDFSIATLIEADTSHLTTPWAGSPGYMAPEVWRLHPGRYSDQYALAISCYYLLTAQLPWQRNNNRHAQSWTELHSFVQPRSILQLRPDLPVAIDVVLQRALSKDPHARYQTVQAFAADLYEASQDITQEVRSLPVSHKRGLAARPITQPVVQPVAQPVAQSEVTTMPAQKKEVQEGQKERQGQQSIILGVANRPLPEVGTSRRAAPRRLPETSPQNYRNMASENAAQTDALVRGESNDKWVWNALALNLLICLAVAAEYAWQQENATSAANMLLAVWPGLLCGPLLAYLFRRVRYSTLPWGVFWGVFFGLTDALVSTLLCFAWIVLALLPTNFQCPSWCAAGDGFKVAYNEISQIAPQAVMPVVLALWIAVIGGALIGVMHVRHS